MRLTVTLSHHKASVNLPMNSSYQLSSLIYNAVERSSCEYAKQLHEQGYCLQNKPFKLFTFSPLSVAGKGKKWQVHTNGTMSSKERYLRLTVSSPKRDFIDHLDTGLKQELFVMVGYEQFRVESVRRLDAPKFTGNMRFVALSPLVCTTKKESERYAQFIYPDNDEFERVLFTNLAYKYEAVHGHPYKGNEKRLRFTLDREYVERRNGKVHKLVTIKQGKPDETQVKGTLAPFRLEAPPELIQIGYDCGFGEKNSQGFGMVKLDTYR
jgi:CRISPR-associated endoribonuclease Cas6